MESWIPLQQIHAQKIGAEGRTNISAKATLTLQDSSWAEKQLAPQKWLALRILGSSNGRVWTCIAGVRVLKLAIFEGSGFLGWRIFTQTATFEANGSLFTWNISVLGIMCFKGSTCCFPQLLESLGIYHGYSSWISECVCFRYPLVN